MLVWQTDAKHVTLGRCDEEEQKDATDLRGL